MAAPEPLDDAAFFGAAARLLAYPDGALERALAAADAEWAPAPGLAALQEEYTRLFVTAVPAVPAPPYEACYGPGDAPTLLPALDALYAAAAYAPPADGTGRTDHVVAELGFVAHLLARGDDHAARAFVRAHLAAWLPAFTDAVNAAARLPYYPRVLTTVAAELEAWLHG